MLPYTFQHAVNERIVTPTNGTKRSPAGTPPVVGSNSRNAPATVPRLTNNARVTLSPTSRLGNMLMATPPLSGNSGANGNLNALALPGSADGSNNNNAGALVVTDRAAVDAVQTAYEKTEAHLRVIQEKLEQMQEEMRQSPPRRPLSSASPGSALPFTTAAPLVPPVGKAGGAVTALRGGSGTGAGPAVTAAEPGNKAGAHHHLQPISTPTEAAAPRMPAPPPVPNTKTPPSKTAAAAELTTAPAHGSKSAAAKSSPLNPAATLLTPADAKSAAAKPAAETTAAAKAPSSVSASPAPVDHGFSIDEGHILETPQGSSNSDDSSSSDDERGGGGDLGSYLPAAARKSFVKPRRPPSPLEVATAGSILTVGATKRDGPPMRQGVGFKNRITPAGGAPRRNVNIVSEEGNTSNGDAATAAMKAAQEASNEGSIEGVSSETGEVFALGRRNRRASPVGHTEDGMSFTFNGTSGTNSFGNRDDNAKAVDGMTDVSRRQSHVMKNLRESFFAPVPRLTDIVPHTGDGIFDQADVKKVLLPGATCSWLCCISLAISFVSGIPTPVEKVLRTNHMGVHYISLAAVSLAELYDITDEYIHTRFHRGTGKDAAEGEFQEDEDATQYLSETEVAQLVNIHCEMATFDTEVIDPESGEDITGRGEHAPISNLATFRKELVQHIGEQKYLYIVNYDPYIVEQAQLKLRSNMCDTDEEMAAVMRTARYSKRNTGNYGIIMDFDAVKHTVTLLTPHLTKELYELNLDDPEDEEAEDKKDGGSSVHSSKPDMHRFESVYNNLVLEQQTVSLQVLYESLNQKDSYTLLSRGFVRVFHDASFAPKIPSIFPLFVLDGSSAGGLMTSVLDVKIAPHILGLAMVHHLAVTFLLSDNARRKQSSRNLLSKANVCDVKLRGIPLTKICQQLRLPLSMIVCASSKSSIATVYVWYHLFLQQLQVGQDVRLGLVLPSRREGAEDGQPNITDTEFLNHLKLVVKSKSVMLISFNLNIAVNVNIDSRAEPAHFAIVIGLDEEKSIVRLADVNVKRFRKTWHIPLNRLYNAVMGYGYMVATNDKKVIKALNGKQFQDSVLQCAKYFLPPPTPSQYQRFEYPTNPYPVTVLADAVERLGFPTTNVGKFLNFSGFHISYFFSYDMPLECASFVIDNFSHYALDDAVSIKTKHYDFHEGYPPPLPSPDAAEGAALASDYPTHTEMDLLEDIMHALEEPSKRKLIVKYDAGIVAADPVVWNGNNGSSYAFVMDYEAATRMVVLSDASPSSYYRTFACPLTVLFGAVCSWDLTVMRGRGTILLTTETSQEAKYVNTKGYDPAHALVHHPFKPIFSSACSSLALAATEMMMNIEAPGLLGGATAGAEEDQNRKYKRYNNIFSAEDFLYALPSFSVRDWRIRPMDSQDVVAIANNAFATLKLPLRAVDVLRDQEDATDALKDPVAFLRACSGVSGLLTITLVAYDTGVVHGVPGTSVGVVNRVHIVGDDDDDDDDAMDGDGSLLAHQVVPGAPANSVGSVQLLEGDPCRWGANFERSAEELMRAMKGIYLVEALLDEDEDREL